MFGTLLVTLILAQWTYADAGTCVTVDPKKSALLEGIKPLSGKDFEYVGPDGTSYKIKFCMDVSVQHPNASVIKISTDKKSEIVLGRHNETDIIVEETWTVVTFTGGDFIGIPGHCNNSRWSTIIIVDCHTAGDVVHLLDPINAACAVFFHIGTPLVCSLPKQSRWTVFFMLILTAAVCYLVIGMAYRRFVTGAKGMEQIPNYDFWKDPCGYTRDYCKRRDMRRNEPWSRASPMADNVDEPLLHP